MKQSFRSSAFFVALLQAVALTGFSQQKDSLLSSAYLSRPSPGDSPLLIQASAYQCTFAGSISLTIRQNCDNYLVEWKRGYNKWALQKPREGMAELSYLQVNELLQIDNLLQTSVQHKELCRGVDRTLLVWHDKQQEYERCGCTASVFEHLVRAIEVHDSARNLPAATLGTK